MKKNTYNINEEYYIISAGLNLYNLPTLDSFKDDLISIKDGTSPLYEGYHFEFKRALVHTSESGMVSIYHKLIITKLESITINEKTYNVGQEYYLVKNMPNDYNLDKLIFGPDTIQNLTKLYPQYSFKLENIMRIKDKEDANIYQFKITKVGDITLSNISESITLKGKTYNIDQEYYLVDGTSNYNLDTIENSFNLDIFYNNRCPEHPGYDFDFKEILNKLDTSHDAIYKLIITKLESITLSNGKSYNIGQEYYIVDKYSNPYNLDTKESFEADGINFNIHQSQTYPKYYFHLKIALSPRVDDSAITRIYTEIDTGDIKRLGTIYQLKIIKK